MKEGLKAPTAIPSALPPDLTRQPSKRNSWTAPPIVRSRHHSAQLGRAPQAALRGHAPHATTYPNKTLRMHVLNIYIILLCGFFVQTCIKLLLVDEIDRETHVQ